MSDLRAFFGPNAGYVLELYERYHADPASVDAESRAFFATLDPADDRRRAGALQRRMTAPAAAGAPALDVERIVGAAALAQAIREYGHLAADIDPLGKPLPGAPELDPAFHGITEADLQLAAGRASSAGRPPRARPMPPRRSPACAPSTSGTAGFDFDHVQVGEGAALADATRSNRADSPRRSSRPPSARCSAA